MLPKKNRLSKTKEFALVYKKGRSFFSKNFVLKYAQQDMVSNKFAVVVSTKVSKKAVVRNRIKRTVRNFFKEKIESGKPGYYVIIARSNAGTALKEQLVSDLDKLFQGFY